MINKKCTGCGAILQYISPKLAGYIDKDKYDDATTCQRCFKIKNYGEYQKIENESEDYKKIFDKINVNGNLVLFICDILSLSLDMIKDIKADVILVITKCDLLPKSVKEYKLREYVNKHYDFRLKDLVFVSAIKNYNIDLLISKIEKIKNNRDVYLLGKTNSGKSTLINQICKARGISNDFVTTSMFPETTIDTIKVNISENFNLIDTPGLIDKSSYTYNIDTKLLKKITPKKEIKPITYQMKPNQSILIDNLVRIDYLSNHPNSFTIYMSRNMACQRISLKTNNKLCNLKEHYFVLPANKDVVISGLLFCKIVKDAKIKVYVKDSVFVYDRDNLI